MEQSQTTLRDVLEESFDKVEAAAEAPAVEAAPVAEAAPEPEKAERVRDEQGKFAAKEVVKEQVAEVKADAPQAEDKPANMRPTTWKKEYLPIWDKLSTGTPLTPGESAKLAAYSQQRENEYKTGVSTYKAEAQQAKALQDAIAPFVPDLQAQNIQPNQFIQNLGNAHMMLVKGSPEQKLSVFTRLAHEYGVPIAAIANQSQGQAVDQTTMQLMSELQALKSQVSGVAGWKEQLEVQQIQSAISEYQNAEKYPYFEMVRGNMAQLLESGQAQDLKEAYEKATEPFENLFNQRLEQVKATQAHATQDAVKQAKAKAVSTKSATPSGAVVTTSTKDRRALLSEAVDNLMGSSRV